MLVPGDDVAGYLDDALTRPRALLGRGAADPVAPGPAPLLRPPAGGNRSVHHGPRGIGRRAVNVLVVMKHRGDAGNTHAVANYMRLAPKHGHAVAIFGTPIWYVPELRFSTDIRSFDRVMYVYESELYRIGRMSEAIILARFPQGHRLIMDTDGMYNPVVTIDGYDFNHASEAERTRWIDHLDALGGKVMQTTIAAPIEPRAQAMTFYGYNPARSSPVHISRQAVRYPPPRSQLVEMERGFSRAAAGDRGGPRRDRAHRLRRPVVGCASVRGIGGRPARRLHVGPGEAATPAHRDAQGGDVPRCHPHDEHGAHQHHDAATGLASPEAPDAQVFRDLLRRHCPAADAGCRARRGRIRPRRAGAEPAGGGRRASCSMSCAAPTTIAAWSRTSAGISSRTTPTTGRSRSFSPRCGADRR